MDVKGIKLNKKASLKLTYCITPFICHSYNDKTIEMKDRLLLPGLGKGVPMSIKR